LFISEILNEVPDVTFEFAKSLFKSNKTDEFYLGLYSLFKKYADRNEVWDLFIDFFKTKNIGSIPPILVYYLSHCPWHPDLSYSNDSYTNESQQYGTLELAKFEKDDVIKLLGFVDQEDMLGRGTLGQSVESIISVIKNYDGILKEIISDENLDFEIREIGAVIYAYKKGAESIPVLQRITDNDESWYVSELIKHINEYGEFNPYG
ncbi:hypothetical protein, partial [Psychroflexus sp. MES1-P1E]|uniref:hypothetical protein n=1 Tax=Psychroflexus sp. MES1-P1E TaxID=2058320 RepID=UPI001C60E839